MSGLDALAAAFGLPPAVASDPALVTSREMLEAHRLRPCTRSRELGLSEAATINSAYFSESSHKTGPDSTRQEGEPEAAPANPVKIPPPKTDKEKIHEKETCKVVPKHVDSLEEKRRKEHLWGKLPKQEKTPLLERDIEVVRRRSSLDPSKHYKLTGWEKGKHPYVVSGDVVLSAYEKHRQLPKRLRGNSLFDELIKNDPETRERLARRAEKTPLLERDIEVVRRRSSLDPSKHYKLTGWEKGKHPYVVSGDVVLSAYEKHRQLPKRLRGNSLFDELIKNDPETRERLARRAEKARNTRSNRTVIRISKKKARRGKR